MEVTLWFVVFFESPSPSLYSFHMDHQLPFPNAYCQPHKFHSLSMPPVQFSPSPSLPLPTPTLSPPWVPVFAFPPLALSWGIYHWSHWGGRDSPNSVWRLSQPRPPQPPLSCSHVVWFLSPSVVFLSSACVCTECHEFDIVIA